MDSGAFSGLESFFKATLIVHLLSIPLALWKLIDIVIWIVRHVSVDWN